MTLYQTPGVREAVVAAMLRLTLRLLLKPVFSPRFSMAFQRRWVERMTAGALLAPGVRIEPAEVGGVPGEWLRPPGGVGERAGRPPGAGRSRALGSSDLRLAQLDQHSLVHDPIPVFRDTGGQARRRFMPSRHAQLASDALAARSWLGQCRQLARRRGRLVARDRPERSDLLTILFPGPA